MTMEDRLTKLESRLRWLYALVAATVVLAVMGGALHFHSGRAISGDTVTARTFEVVDAHGETRALLRSLDADLLSTRQGVSLVLVYESHHVELSATEMGSLVQLYQLEQSLHPQRRRPAASIWLGASEPGIELTNGDGKTVWETPGD